MEMRCGVWWLCLAGAAAFVTDAPARAENVYWGTAEGGVARSTVGSAGMQLLTERHFHIGSTLAISQMGGYLFWFDATRARIFRSRLDGSDIRTIACNGVENPKWLAACDTQQRLYWTEHTAGEVRSVSYDGGDPVTVLSGLPKPYGIAIDDVHGDMYLTGAWMPAGIRRATLAGEGLELAIPTTFGDPLRGLTLPTQSQILFWIQGNKVRSATLEGNSVTTLPVKTQPDGGLAATKKAGRLYRITPVSKILVSSDDGDLFASLDFVPEGPNRGLAAHDDSGDVFVTQVGASLWRADVSNEKSTLILTSTTPDEPVWAMTTDRTRGRVYWVEPTANAPLLVATNAAGGDRTVVSIPTWDTVYDIIVDGDSTLAASDGARDGAEKVTIYLCESTGISRIDATGEGYEPIFTGIHFATGFDRDRVTGAWYWVSAEQFIFRAGSHGDDPQIFGAIDGLASDLVIDGDASMIYWLQYSPEGRLMRSPLEAFDPDVVVEGFTAGSRLELDPIARVLHFTDALGGYWSWSIEQGGDAVKTDLPAVLAGLAVGLPEVSVADLTADGLVDGADLGLMIGHWGECGCRTPCAGDFDHDGVVDGSDLGVLLANWTSSTNGTS